MRAPSFYSDPHVQFLSQLLEEIGDGGLQVPRFQRPLVWNWERRLELLRSIRDGIPIGAIMVWRTNNVIIDCYDKLGPHVLKSPSSGVTRQYLLDGVQRLSTLYGALHRPSPQDGVDTDEFLDVETSPLYDDEEPSEVGLFDVFFDPVVNDFIGPHQLEDGTGILMPISLVFDSVALLRFQRNLSDNFSDGAIKAIDELARSFRDYKLPVIPITTDDINLATRTFQRINSQGAKMSETHMVHALTWQPNFDLQHKLAELKDVHLAERGWGQLDNDPILKACKAAFGLDVYKASADELSKRLVSEPNVLTEVFQSLAKAADFLWECCGIKTPDMIPYALQIVVLADGFRVQPSPTEQIRNLLHAWLWVTTYGELFAGMSGDRVQLALADMHKTVNQGVGVWTWRRPFEDRPLRSTFDFRAARAKAYAFRLAALRDEIIGGRAGTRILADSGRKALAQVIPWSIARKAAYSSPGNRFLVQPAEAHDFRDLLLSGELSDQERMCHAISDEAYGILLRGQYAEFTAKRIADIERLEHRFLQPLISLFEQQPHGAFESEPRDVLAHNPLVEIIDSPDSNSFIIRFGEMFTPITIKLFIAGDYVEFETSHAIETPLQAGPYWPSRPFGVSRIDAMRQAVRSIELYYHEAVAKNYRPEENWLVPRNNYTNQW